MTQFILEDRTFGLSGEPSQLEYYRCYYDPANRDPITGEELLKLENTPDWNDEKSAVWGYFYRPYNFGSNIGPLQRERIAVLKEKISVIKESLSINVFLLKLLPVLIIASIYPILQHSMNFVFYIFAALYGYLCIHNLNQKERLRSYEKEKAVYKRELRFLLDQKENIEKHRLSARAVESIFWDKVKTFESAYIEKTFKAIPDEIREECSDFYSNKLLEDYGNFEFPTFPVIPSWGLLQSSVNNYAGKDQETGLKILADELKELCASFTQNGEDKIATWRKVSQGLFWSNET